MSTRDHLRAAVAAHQAGKWNAADALYQQVLAESPAHAEALRLRGVLARQRGDLSVSIDLLSRAAELAPADSDALSELGLSLLAAGDLLAAEAALRGAVEKQPDSVKALTNLGAVFQYRQNLDEAIACYRQALTHTSDAGIRANLASALLDAGRGDEALAECNAALALPGGDPLLRLTRGTILNGLGRHDDALADLQAAVARDLDDEMAWINLAYAQRQNNDPVAARNSLERGVAVNPDNARGVADLIAMLVTTGDTRGARALGEDYLSRHPGERQVLAVYAYACAEKSQGGRALLDFQRLIKTVQPGPPQGYATIATFNDDLRTLICAHPSLRPGSVTKATRGGGQTRELAPNEHPALAGLGEIIDAAVGAMADRLMAIGMADHPAMAYAAPRWWLRLWGNVLTSGGQQIPHMHPMAWLSGVYYVSLPEDMAAAGAQAGWLEFGRPPDRIKLSRPPEVRTIEPREGQLVLFPSYFFHSTRAFTSSSQRISIAFDAIPDGGMSRGALIP
jgi:uncharacterized protein (TIGR02466 family)